MNKTLLFVIPFLLLIFFSGCSQVQYLTGVEILNPHLGWQYDTTSVYGMFRYVYKDSLLSFSVHVSSGPKKRYFDACFIMFGPPLIPIIPNIFEIFQQDEIGIFVKILSNPDSISFDVENIHILLEDGLTIPPSEIYRTYKSTLKLNELIRDGDVGIWYKLPRKSIEKFQIVFGKLLTDDGTIVPPSLNYTRWSKYRWVFWMFLAR